MNVYLVRKIVSYKKDVFGAFASKKKAIENAKNLAREQRGTNLIFDVVSMPLDSFKTLGKNEKPERYYATTSVFSSAQ